MRILLRADRIHPEGAWMTIIDWLQSLMEEYSLQVLLQGFGAQELQSTDYPETEIAISLSRYPTPNPASQQYPPRSRSTASTFFSVSWASAQLR